jgi:holo-[acyl-carrier protein] synthase
MKGLGIDIVEIARIKEMIAKYDHHFLDRLFTKKEQQYCLKKGSSKTQAIHFAGRFAAKEAIAKALGCGFGQTLSFHDIEINNNSSGKPSATLSTKAHKTFKKPKIHISISHCHDYATAVALIE